MWPPLWLGNKDMTQQHTGQERGLWIRTGVSSPLSYDLGKSIPCSAPQFPHLQSGSIIPYLTGFLWGWPEGVYGKPPAESLYTMYAQCHGCTECEGQGDREKGGQEVIKGPLHCEALCSLSWGTKIRVSSGAWHVLKIALLENNSHTTQLAHLSVWVTWF